MTDGGVRWRDQKSCKPRQKMSFIIHQFPASFASTNVSLKSIGWSSSDCNNTRGCINTFVLEADSTIHVSASFGGLTLQCTSLWLHKTASCVIPKVHTRNFPNTNIRMLPLAIGWKVDVEMTCCTFWNDKFCNIYILSVAFSSNDQAHTSTNHTLLQWHMWISQTLNTSRMPSWPWVFLVAYVRRAEGYKRNFKEQ